MGGDLGVSLFHQGLMIIGVVGGPILGALLVVGLGVGVLQAATQVNDPAVGFLPRMTALLAVLWLMGPWIVQRLAAFFAMCLQQMTVR
ncbi:MAG: flagellar biosynthetic protein FliQ [Deltaproteobacteria bacterium]|nr:flagellar biosynthetic protein FliQ [Deltaproteobacteria bacterium]